MQYTLSSEFFLTQKQMQQKSTDKHIDILVKISNLECIGLIS